MTVAPGCSRPIIDQLLLWRASSDRSVGRERERQPQLDLGIDEEEVGRQDADDRVRLAVDAQVAADGVVSPAVELLPEPVGQDDLAICAELAFGLREDAAAERLAPSSRSSEGRASMLVTRCGSPLPPIVTPRVL